MAISKRLRYEIMLRDNHACRYCGATAPDVKLTIDHVTPVALGGTDEPSNLVTACSGCNAGKSSSAPGAPLVEDVKADALRWTQALKMAAENLAAKAADDEELFAGFSAIWLASTYTSGGKTYHLNGNLPSGWQRSLREMYDRGLPLSEIEDGARIVSGLRWSPRDPFSYLMGVLNVKSRELLAEARRLIDEETTPDGA